MPFLLLPVAVLITSCAVPHNKAIFYDSYTLCLCEYGGPYFEIQGTNVYMLHGPERKLWSTLTPEGDKWRAHRTSDTIDDYNPEETNTFLIISRKTVTVIQPPGDPDVWHRIKRSDLPDFPNK